MKHTLYQPILRQLASLSESTPGPERKLLLDSLTAYIRSQVAQGRSIGLNFICTHNSRRSQLGQVWAQTMAAYFDIPNVHTYSGGTETTQLYPQIAKTLEAQGFQIKALDNHDNPKTAVKYADDAPAIILFSKYYDDFVNPKQNYAAILTCSEADEACPAVPGAQVRIALPYEDPKAFDNSDQMEAAYLRTSNQIAIELYYTFSKLYESK